MKDVTFIWYHPLGEDRTYHLEENDKLRPSLLNFLKSLHLHRNSIVYFGTESVEKAFQQNPQFQEAYEKRRKELLENPRLARFPPIVFNQHRKLVYTDNGDIDTIERADMLKYREGAEEGEITDFKKLEKTIVNELEEYESVLDLTKDTNVGYAKNLAVFSFETDKNPAELLNEVDWHLEIGRKSLPSKGKFFVDLESFLSGNYENMTVKELNLTSDSGYIALSTTPKKFVCIASDLPEHEKTISAPISELSSAAFEIFREKMGWSDMRYKLP